MGRVQYWKHRRVRYSSSVPSSVGQPPADGSPSPAPQPDSTPSPLCVPSAAAAAEEEAPKETNMLVGESRQMVDRSEQTDQRNCPFCVLQDEMELTKTLMQETQSRVNKLGKKLQSASTTAAFFKLSRDLQIISVLLEWIPSAKEYSILDVAVASHGNRKQWLALLCDPVLRVDLSFTVPPDPEYYRTHG